MIRFLFFLMASITFLFPLEIHKPLFPHGEKVQNFIINSPLKPINALMSHSGKFVITLEDEYFTKLRIWDIANKKIIFQLNYIDSISKQLKLSKDDRYLVYDDFEYIVLFDMKKRKIKQKIKVDSLKTFDISKDGKYIVMGHEMTFDSPTILSIPDATSAPNGDSRDKDHNGPSVKAADWSCSSFTYPSWYVEYWGPVKMGSYV